MQKPLGKPGSSYITLMRAIVGCGSIGILSSGLVMAQSQAAPDGMIDPTTYSTPVNLEPAPADIAPIAPPEAAPVDIPIPEAAPEPPLDYSNVYIDPTNYNVGSTENNYEEPNSVVLSERSSGCEAVLGAGESPSGGVCGGGVEAPAYEPPATAYEPEPVAPAYEPPVAPQTAEAGFPPLEVPYTPTSEPALAPAREPQIAQQEPNSPYPAYPPSSPEYQPETYSQPQEALASDIQPINVGPVSVSANGIGFSSTVPNEGYSYNPSMSRPPLPMFPGNGNTSILFPLSIPAPITSVFGWRIHPISGGNSFHSGTDLGAPMGTPVLAALKGIVEVADYLGGYGLAVIIKHSQGTQETLYAHLSEILVRPGQQIEQGTPIGRVGSTGNSTGPHLHFEFRQLTANGWDTLDAGRQLEVAMAQMVQGFQTVQTPPIPPSSKKGEIPVIALPAPQAPIKGPVLETASVTAKPPVSQAAPKVLSLPPVPPIEPNRQARVN
ncbi:MAG TPA: peptidoglycan DD-metalloendopeptidase family protein [Halomicronema sp.]